MPVSKPRNILPLFGLAFHTCTAIRLATDEDFSVDTTSSACQSPVKETQDGQCVSGAGESVPFYCCNILRSCRRDANIYLDYYARYLTVYEKTSPGCAMTDADFTVSRNGQALTLNAPAPGIKSKVCSPDCRTDRELQQKQPLDLAKADLVLKCNTTVEDNIWLPQLDSANWPSQKVMALDEVWITCGVKVVTTTTTAIFISTQTTTTLTFTAEEPVFEEVDMSFMGDDLNHPGRAAVGLRFWRWGYRKINPDVKEEVTRNHFCADKGSKLRGVKRDQTYYASTLCYWIPTIKPEEVKTTRGVGLAWIGSSLPGVNGPVCKGLDAVSGQCVKCSTCHNNAMSEDGKVSYTSWAEKIVLSAECKNETEVDDYCLQQFYIKNEQLVDDVDACKQEEALFQAAYDEYNRVRLTIPALERLINHDIPAQIAALDKTIKELSDEITPRQKFEYNLMSLQLEPTCSKAINSPLHSEGFPSWWKPSEKAVSTRQLVNDMLYGGSAWVVGSRPSNCYIGCDYDRRIQYWGERRDCKQKIDELASSNSVTNVLVQEKEMHINNRKAAYADLANRKVELKENQDLLPIVKQKYDDKEASWVTSKRKEQCQDYYDKLEKDRPPFMQKCIEDEFEGSCENECLEKQGVRYEGCGVMEGAMPVDPTSKGGIVGGCLPPYPSWMKGPWTWSAEEEPSSRQCTRIFNTGTQTPRHTQRILATGWMEKRSRWKTHYNRRFFMFESGDQVRSAIIRYFGFDPKSNHHAEERFNKKIIVWDAKKVENSGSYCFILYHFYRNYKLCPEDEKSSTRDKWVGLIRQYLRFPSK